MYGCDSTPGVDFLSPAMVDFDLWLGSSKEDQGRTKSHLEDQLKLAQEISRATQGRVHMFAPFNPLRAACDSAYVTLYQDAIEKYGCIGFKLYPPMGFSPWDNATILSNRSFECSMGRANAAALDNALADFYEFSAERALPILAHASPSNGASPGSSLLGSPAHWEATIAQHPTLFAEDGTKIRLNFGHFGGDHDASTDEGRDWTAQFAQMMTRHSLVYADLSYYARLLQGANGQERIAQILGPLLAREPYASRAMYGSDWIMLGIESGYQTYLTEFNTFITTNLHLPKVTCEKILGSNAKRFLGLEPGAKGRTRIEQFHRQRGQKWAFSDIG